MEHGEIPGIVERGTADAHTGPVKHDRSGVVTRLKATWSAVSTFRRLAGETNVWRFTLGASIAGRALHLVE